MNVPRYPTNDAYNFLTRCVIVSIITFSSNLPIRVIFVRIASSIVQGESGFIIDLLFSCVVVRHETVNIQHDDDDDDDGDSSDG